MKQTLRYYTPTIASTESKINPEAYARSIELYENKDYISSIYALLDFINSEVRVKYSNSDGTEFNVAHGSIIVGIKIVDDRLEISAPFLAMPDKGRVPLLRQIAELNINVLDLACIVLRDGKFYFSYDCPLAMAHPAKIHGILYDICSTGDKYDDEFVTKFGAERIYNPVITPYSKEVVERLHGEIQQACKDCLDGVKYFEAERKLGCAWNIMGSTLYKIVYSTHPQGQLLNDLDRAIREHDREDIPVQEVIARSKDALQKIMAITPEQLSDSLYFVDTFVSDKRRSNLQNIQSNFEDYYNNATGALNANNATTCCLMIIYKFYQMYYYNNVQDDINAIVSKALRRTSAMPWHEAAPILHRAMEKIMDDDLEDDDDDNTSEEAINPFAGIDMKAIQKMGQSLLSKFLK